METLLNFIQRQPKGYQADLADITWETYSRINTTMSKLRKGKKLNAFEVTILMKGISILEGKDYSVMDFQWQN